MAERPTTAQRLVAAVRKATAQKATATRKVTSAKARKATSGKAATARKAAATQTATARSGTRTARKVTARRVTAARTGTGAAVQDRMLASTRATGSHNAVDLAGVLTKMLIEATDEEVASVEAAVASPADELDSALWGPTPSPEEVGAGLTANLLHQFAARRKLEEASVSRSEAADLLGITPQAVTGYIGDCRLVAFRRGREWFIPAWQFDPDSTLGVLGGIDTLVRVFPGGAVRLSGWATRPNVDLDDATPRDVLARGDVETVVGIAGSLTAAGW